MTRSQQGVSLLAVAVMLGIAMAVLIAFVTMFRSTSKSDQGAQVAARMESIKEALAQFASTNGRLPCPAIPTADTGDADPPNASAACNSPTGTLPWRAIGMRREDSLDPWGFRISYRVYTGALGSVTQQDGASAVKCECDGAGCESAPTAPTAVVAAGTGFSGGLCADPANTVTTTYSTPQQSFLNGKGLTVTDFGRAELAAYVLISHGPSGLGGYTTSGTATAAPANPVEIANMQAAGPFTAAAPMTTNMSPNDVNYFDDIIAYERLPDLVRRANLQGRDWFDPPATSLVSYKMDEATVSAAVGAPVTPGTLGNNRIDFGTGQNRARVEGFDSGGNQDISYNTVGGAPGLGIAGNGNNLLTSTGSEKLRIDFQQAGAKFGIALADFGTYDLSGTTVTERVQLVFSGVGPSTFSVTLSGCRADGGVATFSVDPGIDFNRVEIQALAATPSGTTALSLAAFNLCDTSPGFCLSGLDATTDPNCP